MARRCRTLLVAALGLILAGGCAQTQQAWEGTKRTVSGWFRSSPVSADGVAAAELPGLVIAKPNVVPKVGPDASAKPAGALRKGDRVARLEVQGNWVRVWVPDEGRGRVVWVNREAVQLATGDNLSGTVPFSALLAFRVTVAKASLRETPDAKAKAVAEVKQGAELRFLDARGGWFKVADPESRQVGWITQGALGRSS